MDNSDSESDSSVGENIESIYLFHLVSVLFHLNSFFYMLSVKIKN
jgi:hypothetical protein